LSKKSKGSLFKAIIEELFKTTGSDHLFDITSTSNSKMRTGTPQWKAYRMTSTKKSKTRKKTVAHRRIKSTRRKDGKIIKYKYPNKWSVSRNVPVAGRDLKITDRDLKRIGSLGTYDFILDPESGEEVIDAWVEDPPRPDRDSHLYLSNKKLEAWEFLTNKYKFRDMTRGMIKRRLSDAGYENPGAIITYWKNRGWITTSGRGDDAKIEFTTSPHPSFKIHKFMDRYRPHAVVLNSRSAKQKDIAFFNSKIKNNNWELTTLGNNLIYFRDGDADKWKQEYDIFQLHDQGVASDSYKPVVFKLPGTFRGPTLAYSDLDGNGLLIKNLDTDLSEARNEVDSVKIGRYIGAGVPKDARVIKKNGDYYVIEKLIPRHTLWKNATAELQNMAIKDTPSQAGRALVFHSVTQLTDRHGGNILITKRGKKYNISDIDFGFTDWTSGRIDPPHDWRSPSEFRVPSRKDKEALEKYLKGRQDAINRIVKLHHLKATPVAFAHDGGISNLAEHRERVANPVHPKIPDKNNTW